MSPGGTVPLGTARLAVFLPFLVSLFLGTSLFRCPLLLAGPLTAHHDLHVSLFPESQRLVGFDRITVEPVTEAIVVELAPRVEVHTLTVEGSPQPIRRRGAELVVSPPTGETREGGRWIVRALPLREVRGG